MRKAALDLILMGNEKMINYFNFKRLNDNSILITNDFGEYSFVENDVFINLLKNKVDKNTEKGLELINKGFYYDGSTEEFIQHNTVKLDNMKPYVFSSPSLHIFVVTTACNGDCLYCQAHSSSTTRCLSMDYSTAEKAVDIALQSPLNHLTFEFQGGEPLINIDTISHIIEYAENKRNEKHIDYCLVSNLSLLTDDMIDLFKKNSVSVSTSLDGLKELHDQNRPMKSEEYSMYDATVSGILKLMESGVEIGAIQTTTAYSIKYSKAIVDEYVDNCLHNIFIRPLTPLGMAHDRWNSIGYTAELFNSFYKDTLKYIIKKNMDGYKLVEGHASIFLKKILAHHSPNYMELRSPCGGGIGQITYYPDGDVYTCDEGRMLSEMGNKSFRMGSVFTDSLSDLLESSACRVVCKSSILESLPSCSQCVYQPYCGVCPVVNYAFNNSPYESHPNDYKCKIYKGMLDSIFDLLSDGDAKKVFETWI